MIRDLRLAEHGLRIVERPFSNFVPLPDGRVLRFGGDRRRRREVAKFSARDAEALPAYYARLDRLADQLKKWVLRAPPNSVGRWSSKGCAMSWRQRACCSTSARLPAKASAT